VKASGVQFILEWVDRPIRSWDVCPGEASANEEVHGMLPAHLLGCNCYPWGVDVVVGSGNQVVLDRQGRGLSTIGRAQLLEAGADMVPGGSRTDH
jgi:hypothetical protein